MALSATVHRIRPEAAAEVAEVLGEGPADLGGLSGTGLFVQDDTVVRVFHHGEGDGGAAELIGREDEKRLAPYLRDGGAPVPMVCVQSRFIEDRPAGLAALRYKVKPGHEKEIGEVFAQVQAEARPTLRGDKGQETGVIIGVGLFVKDDNMIRVVMFDGELDDVARYMSKRGGRPEMEKKLAPYMAETRHVETPEQFLEQFKANTMHCAHRSRRAER
ncbi:SchA/CurD-like domain-containing protein [Nocardiopsis potens]|uniref:SchA/CurD-like domain-containing protein n=1 Tax=Nocardiopsis potens TaxID=1246458 RepID=UPI0009DAE367|nr:SchA/CurD-like domain-containing protein [Nocardiopsis potens]